MPKFTYTALKQDGSREQGTASGATALSVGHQLKEQGLTPVKLQEVSESSDHFAFLHTFSGVPLGEKLTFVENLELMLKSGIPVSRSMRILAKQSKNKKFVKVLEGLEAAVENGSQLYEAMSAYPNVFSDIFISMIQVGELSGNLETSLQQLGVQLEREADLRSRVRGAMIYPSVIIGAIVIITVIMSIFVLPKLTSVFKEFNASLPFATRVVVGFSDFMAGHAILVVLGLVLAVGAVVFGLRTQTGKAVLYRVSLVVPGIGPLTIKINIARFTRVLSSLLKSGIPIVQSLTVSAQSIPNTLYKEAILATAEQVKVGKSLTEVLQTHDRLFPFLIVQMLEVGEETGALETILEQIATHYETQIDATLKNMSSIIEPLLLLVIGGAVGALAYALIIPIYNIGSTIQ